MKFFDFLQIYYESRDAESFEQFTDQLGWRDWMNTFFYAGGLDVLDTFLSVVYKCSKGGFPMLIRLCGVDCHQFSQKYGLDEQMMIKWMNGEPPENLDVFVAFAVLSDYGAFDPNRDMKFGDTQNTQIYRERFNNPFDAQRKITE